MVLLTKLMPEYRGFWEKVATIQADNVWRVVERGIEEMRLEDLNSKDRNRVNYAFLGYNQYDVGALYLSAAHEIVPNAGYGEKALEFLKKCSTRDKFYHIARGLRIDRLPELVRGDDYRNVFFAERHIGWLGAYWKIKRLGTIQ